MQEQNWFVAHPEVMRYILKHEQAQELIGRMCAVPLVIEYEEGEIIHTDDKPFCLDPACPCKEDREAVNAVNEAVEAGILTLDEATRLIAGKQL
jgi:hypothetical protein